MKFRIFLILAAMLLSWYSWAQDDQERTTEQALEQNAEEVTAESEPLASEEATESSEDPNQEEEEDEPGRFIPSEQISQDLGVSFPIDI